MPFLVLFLALSAFAQDFAPGWINESWRSARYPQAEWYTGFATDKLSNQPSLKEYKAIESIATTKLSESIVVNIKGVSTLQTENRRVEDGKNQSETTTTNYDNTIKTTSNAVLAKIEVKSYFNKKTGYIYGFASVKRSDLVNFYRSNLNSLFSFANKELAIIEQLAEQGKKNSAYGKIKAIEDSLKNVNYWNFYLQAVESDSTYTQRERDFLLNLNNVKMALENGTIIYFNISGLEDSNDFAKRLSAQMQKTQCNCTITENANEADYIVKIGARPVRCNENKSGDVFCYANVNASVDNQKSKKPIDIKIPEAKGGWINSDKEKATEEAFKKLINNLAENITQFIK
jgi:hypothetical protein